MKRIVITNGSLVLPDRIIPDGELVIDKGLIQYIGRPGLHREKNSENIIDAAGGYVLPGLIDLHSDAIEKEIEPRPGAFLKVEIAFCELEKKLAGHGITTMYHSFSFAGAEWGIRGDFTAAEVVQYILAAAGRRSLIRNKIHLRYEITNHKGIEVVRSLIREKKADLFSFMDHTPGQGQYPTVEDYRKYIAKTYHMSFNDIEELLAKKNKGRANSSVNIKMLSSEALAAGIPMASHDDDSPQMVESYRNMGITINEFPINLPTAKASRELGNHVCVGAPNVVRGGSTGKGLRALDAITAGYANILCSDYYPPSLLHAVFKIGRENMALHEAVGLATQEPARAMNLTQIGSLEEGKIADIIVVNMRGDVPAVTHTIVNGTLVFGLNYRNNENSSFSQGEQSA